MLQQRDQIARHHQHLFNEQRVAKAVFDKVAHAGCLAAPNIRYSGNAHWRMAVSAVELKVEPHEGGGRLSIEVREWSSPGRLRHNPA